MPRAEGSRHGSREPLASSAPGRPSFSKDLFDEHGVAYPSDTWDHDDYLAAMKRLTHDRTGLWGSMVNISWDRIQMHVNGRGGHLVSPDDATDCAMDEPEALAAMEWVRTRISDDRMMATFPDVQNIETREAFASGRLAADFRVGVTPFPAGPARRVTLATTATASGAS